jgi:tRNA (mo5U34)-methyltransferase
VGQGLAGGLRLGSARRPPETPAAPVSPETRQILDRIAGIDWFHTISLPHGVVTPGLYDHGPLMSHYPVPELKGMRVVDVGPGDGFWAFEFEKRGASEVVALVIARVGDLDLAPDIRASMEGGALDAPMGKGFSVARELLGSKVRREVLNVYQISPERIGRFDFAFCGDLLAMLMNPMKALQQLRSVVSGHAQIVAFFNPNNPRKHVLYQGARQGCTW